MNPSISNPQDSTNIPVHGASTPRRNRNVYYRRPRHRKLLDRITFGTILVIGAAAQGALLLFLARPS